MQYFVAQITNPSGARARQARKLLALATIALLACWHLPNRAQAAAGDLDPTFGNGGKVTTAFAGFNSQAQALAIQADGKIVAAGITLPDVSLPIDFAVARYNSDGTLDLSFGTGGKVLTDFSGGSDDARAVAIQPDGKIIVAGSAETPDGGPDFALARYNSDGSLDPSFGTGGKVTTDFVPGFALGDGITAMALQQDGKIIVAGGTFGGLGPDSEFVIARYNSDGSLDPTFGSGGKSFTDFLGLDDSASDVTIQQDGKIVAAGNATVSSNEHDFALARYNADGSLDSSFGASGEVITDFDNFDFVRSVAQQADGKIVASGTARNFGGVVPPGGTANFALARYNTDGSLDPSFGSGGKKIVEFSNGLAFVGAMVLQTDGKIVFAGEANASFALARLNTDGNLDPSFGSGGKVTTSFFGLGDLAIALALQPDGKIVVAGGAVTSQTHFDFALARYDGGGTGTSFDLCLQDDSNGNLLQFNSATGDYQFTNCRKGIVLTGRGSVRVRFCKIELSANKPDHSITALANSCTKVGSASVKLVPSGRMFTVSDSDMTNNTCACR